MKKKEFLSALKKRLRGLPREDVRRTLEYYREIIEDRMEEGIAEEDAIAELGSIEEIAMQYLGECSPSRVKKVGRKMEAWEIVLIILGSPIWASLLIAAAAVAIAVCAVLWSLAIVVWSVFITFAAVGFAGTFGSPLFFFTSGFGAGTFILGAGLLLAGLAILMFFASLECTKTMARLSVALWRFIVRCFSGRRYAA